MAHAIGQAPIAHGRINAMLLPYHYVQRRLGRIGTASTPSQQKVSAHGKGFDLPAPSVRLGTNLLREWSA
ncbi:MAG: hypothetical protein ACLT5P_15330 [Flavonifractor plautii]